MYLAVLGPLRDLHLDKKEKKMRKSVKVAVQSSFNPHPNDIYFLLQKLSEQRFGFPHVSLFHF